MSSVDDSFAWDEGEGDRTSEMWLRDHSDYFARALLAAGLSLDEDTPTLTMFISDGSGVAMFAFTQDVPPVW